MVVVFADGEEVPKGLEVDGDLPASFPRCEVRLERAQIEEGGDKADVDYIFEIPHCGLRSPSSGSDHDEDSTHVIGSEFEVLSRGRPIGACPDYRPGPDILKELRNRLLADTLPGGARLEVWTLCGHIPGVGCVTSAQVRPRSRCITANASTASPTSWARCWPSAVRWW